MESASLNLGVKKNATNHKHPRKTNETDIRVKLNLDGRGNARIATGSDSSITCSNWLRVTARLIWP